MPAPVLSGRISYVLLCSAALGVLFLLELQGELVYSSLLVVVAGLVGLLVPRLSPLLLLLVFAVGHLTNRYFWPGFDLTWHMSRWSLDLTDVLRCGALLAYVAGHYRLQGLMHHLFPPDPRHRSGPARFQLLVMQWLPDLVLRRRPAKQVTSEEIVTLILTLPFFVAMAQVAAFLITRPVSLSGMPARFGRLLLVAWVLGIGTLIVAAAFDYWKRRRMSRGEALLFLQDTAWEETRREQRRVQRAFAAGRLRRQHRKEPG